LHGSAGLILITAAILTGSATESKVGTLDGYGETLEDKTFADMLFFENTLSIVENGSGKLLKIPRTYRAVTYYIALRDAGREAFMKGNQE
jgi:hypothetical protein